jgi:hypothetical protein
MKVGGKLLNNMKCMKRRKREGNEGGNEQNVCMYENITNSLFCIINIYIYICIYLKPKFHKQIVSVYNISSIYLIKINCCQFIIKQLYTEACNCSPRYSGGSVWDIS